jgi:hypothetical protein
MHRHHKTNPALAARGSSILDDRSADVAGSSRDNKKLRSGVQVDVIEKGHCARLRISLTNWRGVHKVEIRELVAAIPGAFLPCGVPITLGIDRLPALIAALQAAEAEARARGLIGG